MGPEGSPSRCPRASPSATRAGEALCSGISCSAAGPGAGARAGVGGAGPLERRGGAGGPSALGMRQLPALGVPLPVERKAARRRGAAPQRRVPCRLAGGQRDASEKGLVVGRREVWARNSLCVP